MRSQQLKLPGGETILIGMGGVTYDSRKVQYESLFNSHHLRQHGTIVNDVAKSHGGKQNLQLKINEQIKNVPLEFDGDIMTLPIHEPTDKELQTLGILWLLPSIESNPRPI